MQNRKQNIVVVDDDVGMNQAIERLLKAAATADCLVLDIHLPGLSGFELCRRLHQIGTGPPVIFITAYEDPASMAQAADSGAVAYFTKPFPGQTLLSAISRAIRSTPDAEGGNAGALN
jgi:FixJ family two-component response regulator